MCSGLDNGGTCSRLDSGTLVVSVPEVRELQTCVECRYIAVYFTRPSRWDGTAYRRRLARPVAECDAVASAYGCSPRTSVHARRVRERRPRPAPAAWLSPAPAWGLVVSP